VELNAIPSQDKWLASLPRELADSVKSHDLRAPKIVGGDYAKPRNSLKQERWEAFIAGQLSTGIFARKA
jgi:hypothetical protein